MSDAVEMRFELQKVAAYRELCRGVRRSGWENINFALIMSILAYFTWPRDVATLIVLVILVGSELLVGLFKWLLPSAEGYLLDGLLFLLFSVYYLGVLYLQFQAGQRLHPIIIFFAGYILFGAFGRFKAYGRLSKLFSQRPTAEHMAWFDELIHEIRTADPQADELALDLPTRPHLKAKLLGTTVFFIALRGTAVWIAGPDDFEILREKTDRGTGWRKAFLQIYNHAFPEFEIGDATWGNYQKWRAANPSSAIHHGELSN